MSRKIKEKPGSPRIEITGSRTPKKKTGYQDPFARIQLHPLEELESRADAAEVFPFEPTAANSVPSAASLPIKNNLTEHKFGNPNNSSETQTDIAGLPKLPPADAPILIIGNPQENKPETQLVLIGNPNEITVLELETQTKDSGRPNLETLDANQPEKGIWKPKITNALDTNQPKASDLEPPKLEIHDKYQKYEKARSTDPIHIRADKAIAKRVRHFLVENKFTLKDFFEVAATKFMDDFGNPKLLGLDANKPYDDRRLKTLYKTTPRIINLFLAYNLNFNEKSKWTVRDDEAGASFNNVDIRLVELGILQTQANKGFAGKINSFSYYAPEIKNFVELNMPSEALDTMLKINRQRWAQLTGKSIDLSFLDKEQKS